MMPYRAVTGLTLMVSLLAGADLPAWIPLVVAVVDLATALVNMNAVYHAERDDDDPSQVPQ
ncbi:hypothetical protein [Nonomuraea wenchangensis]|uniref:hypothetical protein n=1 Tax=Nonomuraea wenchangensis TaxID=568860 RepID=UPI0033225429